MALSKKNVLEFLKTVEKYNCCEKSDCDNCKHEGMCIALYKDGDVVLVSKLASRYLREAIVLIEQGKGSGCDEFKGVPYSEVIEIFNEVCISFSKVKKATSDRKNAIKARFNEGYTIADFKDVFKKAEESSFLKGKNSKDWKADFDFFITERGLVKTREGKYDNKINSNNISDNPSYDVEELDKLIYRDYMKKE